MSITENTPTDNPPMITDKWTGCYQGRWQGIIVDEAMVHPAKYSRSLIERIYDHCVEEGWLCAGDHVLDPFGGIALGAWGAMRVGCHFTGVELEPRFQSLGNANLDLWKRYECIPGWGTARLLQGDSRNLLEVVGGAFECSVQGYDIVISSPPYSETRVGQESGQEHCGRGDQYGAEAGQLGAMSDDFWPAARQIVSQVHAALRPGGHAVWVVKDYVKGGERVPFSDQWRQLCESVGFVTLHEHHAMLVSESPGQMTIDGECETKTTSRKSFFRRLCESKGSPRIDWETVWCMVKP